MTCAGRKRNNKTKVIKRMAYGYCDRDDFFLKIEDAIPLICEEPKKTPPEGGV